MLSVGLSVAFLMLVGLFINEVYYAVGYKTPLSTYSLMISFSLIILLLCYLIYKRNVDKNFGVPELEFKNKTERLLFLIPLTFPLLSVLGNYLMNTRDNNMITLFLLLLIPMYLILVAFLGYKVPKQAYPVAVFTITLSLFLIYWLTSNHIFGADAHVEYYTFQITKDNLYWSVENFYNLLNTCIGVSLLPVIYQSLIGFNINNEYIFKLFYPVIYSVSALSAYFISKKYIKNDFYALIASLLFVSQYVFITNIRTYIALFFFSIAIMVFFNNKIIELKRRLLFIIFSILIVLSHYATTYILLFLCFSVLLLVFISRRLNLGKIDEIKLTGTMIILLFTLMFFWYAQITETPFNTGLDFIKMTVNNLNSLFVEDVRDESMQIVLGQSTYIESLDTVQEMKFVTTYLTLIFIGIGVLNLAYWYIKSTIKNDFEGLNNFDSVFIFITISAFIVAVIMVVLPFISVGYSSFRLYSQVLILLDTSFILGAIYISNIIKIKTRWVLLVVFIPYFMCAIGVIPEIAGSASTPFYLSSNSTQDDQFHVYEQESVSIKWISENRDKNNIIYGDYTSSVRMISQSNGKLYEQGGSMFSLKKVTSQKDYYIILGHYAVMKGIVYNDWGHKLDAVHNVTEYSYLFINKNKIYNNGGSEFFYYFNR